MMMNIFTPFPIFRLSFKTKMHFSQGHHPPHSRKTGYCSAKVLTMME